MRTVTAEQRLSSGKPAPARFTAEEFMELIRHPPISEWQGKVELLEGEIVRMSPANVPHWNAQRLVVIDLQAAFGSLGSAWIVGGEAPVRLGKLTVRVPDVAVLHAPDLKASVFDRAALFMAVEIADTSLRNDLGRKLRTYAAAGVPHYWVVDVRKRETHVMAKPAGSDYAERAVMPHGQPIPVPGTSVSVTLA